MPEGPPELLSAIRTIPDYPEPGVQFKDITPLLADGQLLLQAVDALAEPFANNGITHVLAIEARGFLLGAALAERLGVGLVPVRKPGKLPAPTYAEDYALEYGTDRLEIHRDAFGADARVLIHDDVIATGGTAAATVRLARSVGAEVAGCTFLIELSFLNGRDQLRDVDALNAVIRY